MIAENKLVYYKALAFMSDAEIKKELDFYFSRVTSFLNCSFCGNVQASNVLKSFCFEYFDLLQAVADCRKI